MSEKNQTREKLKKKTKSKMGRKRIKTNFDTIEKEVNMNQVIYWLGLKASKQEIAGSFRISTATLELRIKEFFGMTFSELREFLGDGADAKLRLRRNQLKLSEKSASMGIWLGRQWLNQRDITESINTNKNETIQIYIPDNERDD